MTLDVCYEIEPSLENWRLEKELRLLGMDAMDVFYRPFETLSHGEQTKVLLAILFFEGTLFFID